MKIACRKSMVVGMLLGLFLLMGGWSLYAHSGPPMGPGFGNPEEHVALLSMYLTKKLDLDESQQQELETIAQALLKKGAALHVLRMNARDEVLGILRADSVDAQRMQLLQDQHRETINDFIKEAGNRLTEFLNMLGPEQRQRLAKLIENHTGCCPLQN